MSFRLHKSYYLILNIQHQTGFYGGVGAGSISAHWLHLEMLKKKYKNTKKVGVFFNLKPPETGFPPEIEKDKSLRIFREPLSKTGFFYEPDKKAITTCYKAEGYYTYSEAEQDELLECFPRFQNEYIKRCKKEGDWNPNCRQWLLVSNIKKLCNPILSRERNGLYVVKGFKIQRRKDGIAVNYKSCFHGGWAYKTPNCQVKKLDINEEASYFLKLVLTKETERKLKEINLQQCLIFSLLKKGYWLEAEGMVQRGRFDILFRNEYGKLLVVELKLRNASTETFKQLRAYINSLKKQRNYKSKKFKGIIICGEISDKDKKIAEEHFKFKTIVFHPLIKFVPNLI